MHAQIARRSRSSTGATASTAYMPISENVICMSSMPFDTSADHSRLISSHARYASQRYKLSGGAFKPLRRNA